MRRRGRKRKREREGYRGDGKRLYYTCLGAFSLRLREQDEKARTSLGPSSTRYVDKDGEMSAGRSGRNAEVSSEKGRRSFDPSLTGPLLASFSLVTRIPRPSDQIIVLGVDLGPTWKQRDTYTRLERDETTRRRGESISSRSLLWKLSSTTHHLTHPVSVLRNEKSRGRCRS